MNSNTSSSDSTEGEFFNVEWIRRIQGREKVFHERWNKRTKFVFHRFAERFQRVEYSVDAAGNLLSVSQAHTRSSEILEKNRENILCEFVDVGLQMFGKLADSVQGRIADARLRMLDSVANALNEWRQVFGANVFGTSFSNDCKREISCPLSVHITT